MTAQAAHATGAPVDSLSMRTVAVLTPANPAAKTAAVAKAVAAHGWSSVLLIDGTEMEPNFARAAANVRGLDVLPQHGANVYDILRRDVLVLTKAAVEQLQARLA